MLNIIFIHGLESSGEGFKSQLLKKIFPEILTPTLIGNLKERMSQLLEILEGKEAWIIIGSSYGGLMGSIYACQNSSRVRKLILLAPLLVHPELRPRGLPLNIPVVVFHGKSDGIVPFKPNQKRAKKLFTNLKYNLVNDDHRLHSTSEKIDWKKIIK